MPMVQVGYITQCWSLHTVQVGYSVDVYAIYTASVLRPLVCKINHVETSKQTMPLRTHMSVSMC